MVFHSASQVFTTGGLLGLPILALFSALYLISSRRLLLVGIFIIHSLITVLNTSYLAQIGGKARHAALCISCLLFVELFFDSNDELVVLLDLELLEVGACDERVGVAAGFLVVLGLHAFPCCSFLDLSTLHRLLYLRKEARLGSLLLRGHPSIFSLASFFERFCSGFLAVVVIIVVEGVRIIFGSLDV